MKTKKSLDTYPKLEDELSYAEYKKTYNEWIPKDSVPFDELLTEIIKGEGLMHISEHKGNLLAYFKEIFNKIPKGSDRKKVLTIFLKELNTYSRGMLAHKTQKEGKYLSYYKNDTQKIQGNISSAKKVLDSLIHEGMREETKTSHLSNLLQEYISQSKKMLNTKERIIEPIEIKDYRFLSNPSKKTLEQCLDTILTDFNILIDKTTIRYAMESI